MQLVHLKIFQMSSKNFQSFSNKSNYNCYSYSYSCNCNKSYSYNSKETKWCRGRFRCICVLERNDQRFFWIMWGMYLLILIYNYIFCLKLNQPVIKIVFELIFYFCLLQLIKLSNFENNQCGSSLTGSINGLFLIHLLLYLSHPIFAGIYALYREMQCLGSNEFFKRMKIVNWERS